MIADEYLGADSQHTLATAVQLLSRREHSREELRRKLSLKGHATSAIESVLDSLERDNLLSNERFVEMFIKSRVSRGFGPLHIQAQLYERGVEAELIATSLNINDSAWREHARDVQCRRFGEQQPTNYPERARRMRFLQQRGFTVEQITAAFKSD